MYLETFPCLFKDETYHVDLKTSGSFRDGIVVVVVVVIEVSNRGCNSSSNSNSSNSSCGSSRSGMLYFLISVMIRKKEIYSCVSTLLVICVLRLCC